jgi:hypothetical protein
MLDPTGPQTLSLRLTCDGTRAAARTLPPWRESHPGPSRAAQRSRPQACRSRRICNVRSRCEHPEVRNDCARRPSFKRAERQTYSCRKCEWKPSMRAPSRPNSFSSLERGAGERDGRTVSSSATLARGRVSVRWPARTITPTRAVPADDALWRELLALIRHRRRRDSLLLARHCHRELGRRRLESVGV